MFSAPTAALRLAMLLVWTGLMLPPYAVASTLRWRVAVPMVAVYWRGAARLCGIRIRCSGTLCRRRPALFVANHASYLDILVLGALLPGFFVAKREVKGWPGIGFLAAVARTIFIERRRDRSAEQRDALSLRLRQGDSLILFPEGTSGDGNRVLPFKSALFSIADTDGGRLPVQPVSVAYTRLDGMPIGQAFRPFFAWYGDMTLAPHLWTMLGLGRLTVEVRLHPALTLAEAGSRKELARRCQRLIAQGVALANAGRPPDAPAEGEPVAADVPAAQAPSIAVR